MRYRAISADGHVNEPPTLWTERLPAKFKDRGPRVIETPKTKSHAWIMEGQTRPSPLGFSSIYYRSSKRFDRASVIDGFREIKDRGVRYDDIFPGSWDPIARAKELDEDEIDAEVLFNGVQTAWTGIKLCKDQELKLACFQAYNEWMAEFQAAAPDRFAGNATLPTTGIDDCIDEMHRAVSMGLRTVQIESFPNGSFSELMPIDDRFWAAAVELDIPVNVHTQFVFAVGELLGKGGIDHKKVKEHGIDLEAGSFPMILFRMISSGVFERFPDLKLVGSEVWLGWIPYYLERFDHSVLRNRDSWDLPLLPSEYFRRNVSAVYIVDEAGVAEVNRYDIGIGNIMWGPDFPHSASNWPVDYELGREILERSGATPNEIDRIMWKNAADMFKFPYEPVAAEAVGAGVAGA
ncbi:MAG TPA: amidohydrolase family protein [Acidimicrobiales bacterium]